MLDDLPLRKGDLMKVSCPGCHASLLIPEGSEQNAVRCEGCGRTLPISTNPNRVEPESTESTRPASATLIRSVLSTAGLKRRDVIGIVLGVVLGAAGFGWFRLCSTFPWAGWNFPVGEMVRKLHGFTAIGFAVLSLQSIGGAITTRLQPFCSATGFFVAVLGALCIAGIYLIGTIMVIPLSELAGVLGLHAVLVVVSGILAELLR
jgi:hypothetical protein